MAYSPEDVSVIVRGNLPLGEVWANRWTVRLPDDGDAQDVADAFHDFYATLSAAWEDSVSADSIDMKHLDTGDTLGVIWTSIAGAVSTSPSLPSECALRISLTDAGTPRHTGGPFLPPVVAAEITDDGVLTTFRQTVIAGALEDLRDALAALTDPTSLVLDRTTIQETRLLASARIGVVFDAIRKRRSAHAESYAVVTGW